VWAYATAGHASPDLFEAVARVAVPRLGEFNPQDLANTVWAYATAGHASPDLFEAVARVAVPRLGEFNPQDLASTAWAYAVADAPPATLFGDASFVDCCATVEAAFTESDLSQLHQVQLWLHQECGGTWPQMSPTLAERCRLCFSAHKDISSRMQKCVVSELAALGLQPREEVSMQLGYSLDAVVSVEGRDVAVEVDGPTHFVGRLPTGATVLKRRQLRLTNMPLLAVPYWEWNELRGTSRRRAYLLQRLRELMRAPTGLDGGRNVEEAATGLT
jgi:hypothetical protein